MFFPITVPVYAMYSHGDCFSGVFAGGFRDVFCEGSPFRCHRHAFDSYLFCEFPVGEGCVFVELRV